MPNKDPEIQRANQREAMRRLRASRGHGNIDTEHGRLWKARTEAGTTRRHRFVGVDGEGWTDDNGQHHYMGLVVGDQSLYTGEPLTTRQCLNFLLGFPRRPDVYHVGFFFDYDVTMILRDILRESPETMQEIMAPSDKHYRKMVRWDKYMISYIPKKRFSVRLYGDRSNKFVVHDTRAFFQMSFVKALKTYGITGQEINSNGDREIDLIESMKTQRSGFTLDRAREIMDYCRMECRLLSDLMTEVRDRFADAKMDASPYEGPGPVAGKVLKAHGFKDSDQWTDLAVRAIARQAYYGGRFEIAAHGTIDGVVNEWDLKSAYPWAMTQLPCLQHGVWTKIDTSSTRRAADVDGLWVGPVTWTTDDAPSHPHAGRFGPLPFRMPDGRIMFPEAGNGVYWSVEVPWWAKVPSYVWRYHATCNCDPFAWIERMFKDRAAMERERPGSGIALKLVLNSMYGKLAQRVGARPYFNSVWSGLITALTRARVRALYDQGYPVVMFATDAVFVLGDEHPFGNTMHTDYRMGSGLGEWEHAGRYEHLTIFQPGVYFDEQAAKFKTRGVPMREIRERAGEFIAAANTPDGSVEMRMSNHLGIRQCLAWGPKRYPDLGNWLDAPRTMRVDPTAKRRLRDQQWDGHQNRGDWYHVNGVQWSGMIPGHIDNTSTPYEADPDAEPDLASSMWEEGLHDADDDGQWQPGSVTTKPNTSDARPGLNNATA